jgi:hypothetical protein
VTLWLAGVHTVAAMASVVVTSWRSGQRSQFAHERQSIPISRFRLGRTLRMFEETLAELGTASTPIDVPGTNGPAGQLPRCVSQIVAGSLVQVV